MALKLNISNKLDRLSIQLAQDLKAQQLDVFGVHYIVTQTEGMNAWLKIRNAEQMGIAANTAFFKPNELISKLYIWTGGNQQDLVDADVIRWDLYHKLNEPIFIHSFPSIAAYYSGSAIKRMALATQMADLFDQYPVYRPEMIAQWKTAGLPAAGSSDWQQYLWKMLNPEGSSLHKDKEDVVKRIMEHLQLPDFQKLLKDRMPLISFFGVEVYTPFYLQLYQQLSTIVQLNFYMLNPAPYCYWIEDKSEQEIARLTRKARRKKDELHLSVGNRLLSSWGGLFRETYTMLFNRDEFVNSYDESLAVDPEEPKTLLQKIQYDVFHNNLDGERVEMLLADTKDGTVVVNACFTQVREVEVLYNYLVALVDKKKATLSPRDIVVMVSDIDEYAPYIRAVFDHAPYKFPYTIADESIIQGNNLFAAIETLLALDTRKFKAEQVLELLESPLVRKRNGIHNVEVIRKAVKSANIRFGLEGSMEDDTRYFSWEYGIKRMLYGICISGGELYDDGVEQFYPLDEFEGNDTAELVKFIHLLELLKNALKGRDANQPLSAWVKWLQDVVEQLIFQSGLSEDEDYHRFVHYIEKMMVEERAYSAMPISFDVFRFGFTDLLQHDRRSHTFAGSGITFASLIPMRSIPFKVVAMLGMDYDKFPRKEVKLSFNLIDREKRLGDRSVRENDKHLFLETLLSAQDFFYISYLGFHVKDGSVLPPSSLVDELLSYIASGTKATKESLVTAHPLHGFSQLYFKPGEGKLLNYLDESSNEEEERQLKKPREEAELDFKETTLAELEKFWKDPIKWYFQKNLRVFYKEDEQLLPEEEVFELDSLLKWKLKTDLLHLNETELKSYLEKETMAGSLPLKNVGKVKVQELNKSIQVVRDMLDHYTNGLSPAKEPISIQLDKTFLTGVLERIYGDTQIHVIQSSSIQKHCIRPYIDFLIAKAAGREMKLLLIHSKNNFQHLLLPDVITQEKAIEQLNHLVNCMVEGTKSFYLFYPPIEIKDLKNDYASFRKFLNGKIGNKDSYGWSDAYVMKADDNGFFSEKNYEELKANMQSFYEKIIQFFPNLLK